MNLTHRINRYILHPSLLHNGNEGNAVGTYPRAVNASDADGQKYQLVSNFKDPLGSHLACVLYRASNTWELDDDLVCYENYLSLSSPQSKIAKQAHEYFKLLASDYRLKQSYNHRWYYDFKHLKPNLNIYFHRLTEFEIIYTHFIDFVKSNR